MRKEKVNSGAFSRAFCDAPKQGYNKRVAARKAFQISEIDA